MADKMTFMVETVAAAAAEYDCQDDKKRDCILYPCTMYNLDELK